MDTRVRSRLVAVVIAVCSLLACLAWGLSSAAGSSPDEDFHITSMYCPPPITSSGCRVYYNADGVASGVYAPEKIARANCYAFHPNISGACQDALSRDILVKTDRVDVGNYPGPYFRFAHLFAGPDVQASVGALRLFNTLLATLLIGCAVAVAPAAIRPAVIVGLLVSAVPLIMFLVPSMNPSSWAFAGLTAFWISCLSLADSPRGGTRFAATALALAGVTVACLARNDSIIFVLLALGVSGALYLGRRGTGLARVTLRALWPWLLVVPVALALSVWSYLVSASSAGILANEDRAKRDPMTVLANNLTEALQTPAGILGTTNLGWSDTHMPAVVWVGTIMVAGFVLLRGMGNVGWRKALALTGIGVTLVILPVYMLQRAMAMMGDQVQPRYFMSALPLLMTVALLTHEGRRSLRLGRGPAVLAWLLLSAANAVGLLTNMRRYVSGLNGPYLLGADTQWWWRLAPPPAAVWGIGAVAFAVAAFSLVLLSERDESSLRTA